MPTEAAEERASQEKQDSNFPNKPWHCRQPAQVQTELWVLCVEQLLVIK